MIRQWRNLNFWLVLLVDVVLLVAAHLAAYAVRLDGHLQPVHWQYIRTFLPGLILVKLAIFWFFGLYRGMWRYTGIIDLLHIVKACGVAFLAAVALLVLGVRFEGLSRSIFLLDAVFSFLLVAGHRIALRLYYQRGNRYLFSLGRMRQAEQRKKLLLLGAGDAAEKVVRELLDNPSLPYQVLGFLDDHPGKQGKYIHGLMVLGPIDDLPEVVAKVQPDELLIAIPSATPEAMRRIVELCKTVRLPFKTLPSLGELISTGPSVKAMREVSYRDLLGRPPVRLDQEDIGRVLAGKTVLVTGAGGSIGSELCRQIIRFHPGLLLLLDAGEENLYRIEMELLHEYGFTAQVAVLGKVQDRELLADLFARYRPQVVFHAAAYKHVPLVERNPWEAVYNNVFATKRLLAAAEAHGVERFVLVSTDKAVRPTNVMGASKRLTERLMLAHCGGSTRFMAVRFGNVLGSSGSVIPLFRRQIELGGPVTVTHPEMTRYFMSIDEAAQLILQAASMGEGGEIFILEMGTPVRIDQMARDLIRLCGREPETEIEIKYIGLRPGEKLYEELITEGEGIVATGHEKIMVLRGEGCTMAELQPGLDALKTHAANHDARAIKAVLQALVPEYTPRPAPAVLDGGGQEEGR